MYEPEITVNCEPLTQFEVRVVRLALDGMAHTLERLGFAYDGIAVTDQYMAALSRLRALLDCKPQ